MVRLHLGQGSTLPQLSKKQAVKVVCLKDLDIFVVDKVVTKGEADQIVKAAEAKGFQHQGSRGPAHGEAIRDNGRISLEDPAYARHIWEYTGLQQVFQDITLDGRRAVGLNSNIRIYRYAQGQRFGQHYDDSVLLDSGCETAYTLLIYLSGQESLGQGSSREQLTGGETVFYGKKGKVVAEVRPKAGLALLHKHGDVCLLHEGKAVKVGVKYVLRSDVVFAANHE